MVRLSMPEFNFLVVTEATVDLNIEAPSREEAIKSARKFLELESGEPEYDVEMAVVCFGDVYVTLEETPEDSDTWVEIKELATTTSKWNKAQTYAFWLAAAIAAYLWGQLHN